MCSPGGAGGALWLSRLKLYLGSRHHQTPQQWPRHQGWMNPFPPHSASDRSCPFASSFLHAVTGNLLIVHSIVMSYSKRCSKSSLHSSSAKVDIFVPCFFITQPIYCYIVKVTYNPPIFNKLERTIAMSLHHMSLASWSESIGRSYLHTAAEHFATLLGSILQAQNRSN